MILNVCTPIIDPQIFFFEIVLNYILLLDEVLHHDSMYERSMYVNSTIEQRGTKMKTAKPTNSEAVAISLLTWARAATKCLNGKKRKTAAMRRRLQDLKIIDGGNI